MDYISAAKAWLEQDPDPITRAELEALIEVQDIAGLEARFGKRLSFGTAGLRGELGAGPNRMNRVVVGQTAQGLADFLNQNKETYVDRDGNLTVVIGFDGRVNSDIFAKDSAEILQANGISALLFDRAVPTPVAAFTGRRISSSATVVVTASHNPPKDNGYKVYLGGPTGQSQLTSPQDAEIAALITKTAQRTTFQELEKSTEYKVIGEAEIDAYLERALELIPMNQIDIERRRNVAITHTALHGVGWFVAKQLMERAGFHLAPVASQQEPDGLFPTVSFPNPEEPGAMDQSFEAAKKNRSDLILANDPDADRLAVGELLDGHYQMLTGDQVGLLLANELAPNSKVIANSIVSADLSALADYHGVDYKQTLTGFKWISKVRDLDFGYEEALGYCVDPDFTPDKDGITAALIIAEMASKLALRNATLISQLDELSELIGHTATGQVSIRVTDLSTIDKITSSLRQKPPSEIAGLKVELEDYSTRSDSMKTDALIFSNKNLKVIIRPSGTEPKLKCYLQATGASKDDAAALLEKLKDFATTTLNALQ